MQHTQAPAVSVIVPAYEHADTIYRTLESVFSQTLTDFEVIVVNDGSSDRTAEVLAPLVAKGRIRYFAQQNAGQAAARNRGAAEARGKFFAFLDDDDIWPPDKLAWQVKYLEANPGVSVVAGWCEDFRGKIPGPGVERPFASGPKGSVDLLLLVRVPITSPGQTLLRANLFRELDGFDPAVSGADDYDFWFRALRHSRIEMVPRVALFYRRHSGNFSRDADLMFANCLLVAKRHLSTAAPELQPKLFEAFYRQISSSAGHRLARDWAFLRGGSNHLWSRLRKRGRSFRMIMGEPILRRLFFQGLASAVRRRVRQTRKLAGTMPVTTSLKAVLWEKDESRIIKTKLRDLGIPIIFRPGTSDVMILDKVFAESEYDLPFSIPVRTVVDAGAHIGAATLFYHHRFPDARILAIEPEESNYDLLRKNTEIIPNVVAMQAALWPYDTQLWIQDTAADKATFQVSTTSSDFGYPVPSITPWKIFEKLHVDRIDVLKLDIEGAELDLFASHTDQWLSRVGCLVLELHDRLRPGCAQSLYRALHSYNFQQEIRGENIFILLDSARSNA
jgi:FkbM family methyltransferase